VRFKVSNAVFHRSEGRDRPSVLSWLPILPDAFFTHNIQYIDNTPEVEMSASKLDNATNATSSQAAHVHRAIMSGGDSCASVSAWNDGSSYLARAAPFLHPPVLSRCAAVIR